MTNAFARDVAGTSGAQAFSTAKARGFPDALMPGASAVTPDNGALNLSV